MNRKFFICRRCGNLVAKIQDSGVPMVCCGEQMQELVPNTVDASNEKHLPKVSVDGDVLTAEVGAVAHPMVPEHFIQWVSVETENGEMTKTLKPGDAPVVKFNLGGEKPVAVYDYCNLHGLWKTEL